MCSFTLASMQLSLHSSRYGGQMETQVGKTAAFAEALRRNCLSASVLENIMGKVITSRFVHPVTAHKLKLHEGKPSPCAERLA